MNFDDVYSHDTGYNINNIKIQPSNSYSNSNEIDHFPTAPEYNPYDLII